MDGVPSIPTDEFVDIIKCNICHEVKTNLKMPICRHTVCSDCIKKYFDSETDNPFFSCGVCRKETGRADFKDPSWTLLDVIEAVKKSLEKCIKTYDLCEKHENLPAIYRCGACSSSKSNVYACIWCVGVDPPEGHRGCLLDLLEIVKRDEMETKKEQLDKMLTGVTTAIECFEQCPRHKEMSEIALVIKARLQGLKETIEKAKVSKPFVILWQEIYNEFSKLETNIDEMRKEVRGDIAKLSRADDALDYGNSTKVQSTELSPIPTTSAEGSEDGGQSSEASGQDRVLVMPLDTASIKLSDQNEMT